MDFLDRALVCGDCGEQFVFTAGEQLFFFDKQFKNDPKRCKPCKGKRANLMGRASPVMMASGMARTETRTECSACGVETTVPFKPTQGRPVLCRQCFQLRSPLVADSAMVTHSERTLLQRAAFGSAGMGGHSPERGRVVAQLQSATSELVAAASGGDNGSNSSAETGKLPPQA